MSTAPDELVERYLKHLDLIGMLLLVVTPIVTTA